MVKTPPPPIDWGAYAPIADYNGTDKRLLSMMFADPVVEQREHASLLWSGTIGDKVVAYFDVPDPRNHGPMWAKVASIFPGALIDAEEVRQLDEGAVGCLKVSRKRHGRLLFSWVTVDELPTAARDTLSRKRISA